MASSQKELQMIHKQPRQSQNPLPLCTREQISHGHWIPKRYDRLPYLPSQIETKACYTPQDLHKPWDSYEWQPFDAVTNAIAIPDAESDHNYDHKDKSDTATGCEFTQWDEDLFCQLAFNQTIAIVGDSTSLEHYSALIHMLGITPNEFHEETTFHPDHPQLYFEHPVCPGGSTRLVFLRNNWLFPRAVRKLLTASEPNWTRVEPDALILNRGAWYVPDAGLLKRTHQLLPLVESWQHRCRQRQLSSSSTTTTTGMLTPSCWIVWRTTVPGHPDCVNFTVPSTNKTAMEAYVTDLSHYPDDKSLQFHWYDFARQNKLLLQALDEKLADAETNNYHVMDAYDINILRPDDKVARNGKKKNDCLHNCQPSSVTLLYNQLLLHIMRQQAAAAAQPATT